MTFSAIAGAPKQFTAYKDTFAGKTGYTFRVGSETVFLDDETADKLGRTLLFDGGSEPVAEPEGEKEVNHYGAEAEDEQAAHP